MMRKHALWACGAAAGAAAFAFWYIQRRAEDNGSTHDWGDPDNPRTGAAGQPTAPFPGGPDPLAAWHAVRPGTPHMTAGSRVLRTYAGTLVDDPESLVR